jgi:cob(I)alamin adenosyltransferase
MALYTGKGDGGTTKTFGCDQRISKSSEVAEALGSLDEINSFLGLIKIKAGELKRDANNSSNKEGGNILILGKGFNEIIEGVQQNLFIIQAEVAGSDMTISESKLRECEEYVDEAERLLPPIKTFFVSGGTELAVLCDISRTIVRRAERRVVAIVDTQRVTLSQEASSENHSSASSVGPWTLAYLNRLSSLFYVMARLANHFMGISEGAPSYK